MNTVRIKASQIYKDWHVIDAAGRPLGRVATEAAILLRGKHKPTYEPHLDDGDFVIIVNAAKIRVSGRKSEQIKYYTHSGYPGGLKTRSYEKQLELFPERILEKAVWGMLPGGPLGKAIMKHLKVYKGPEHPHASQIAGSEKARVARAEAGNPFARPATPPRLRPLSVPTVVVEEEAPPAPEAKASPAKEAPAKKTTRKKTEAPEAAAPAPVEEAPEEAVAAAPAEAPEAPKKRAPRKKAEPAKASTAKASTAKASTAKAKTTEEETPKKPARRRAAKKED
ncbi:MAG TPA: 50S ribosomal protein L13 [Tepidiformaceae bacterium]